MDELTRYKMKVAFAGIVEAILAIIEIYIMINFNRHFLSIVSVALIMVVVLFFLITGIIDINLITRQQEQKRYEELYNAQKASYLIIRKSFDEMEERLKSIEEGSALPADEIINAQKAVAKVTISRSKENTDALMNSNDELINQLYAMQEKLESNNDSLIKQQQELMNQVHQKMDDMSSKIGTIEDKVSTGIAVAQVAAPIAPQPVVAAEPVIEPDLVMEEISEEVPEPEITEEILPELESEAEEILPELEDEPVLEEAPAEEPTPEPEPVAEPVVEEAPAVEIPDDPNAMLTPEQIAALVAGGADSAPAEEQAPEPEPEPTVEEAPAVEIPDDPNAMLTPEQIAALVAGGADSAPAEEPDPELETEPAAEAPVAVPDVGVDLSDPNRVMSPEEIEKLFANL